MTRAQLIDAANRFIKEFGEDMSARIRDEYGYDHCLRMEGGPHHFVRVAQMADEKEVWWGENVIFDPSSRMINLIVLATLLDVNTESMTDMKGVAARAQLAGFDIDYGPDLSQQEPEPQETEPVAAQQGSDQNVRAEKAARFIQEFSEDAPREMSAVSGNVVFCMKHQGKRYNGEDVIFDPDNPNVDNILEMFGLLDTPKNRESIARRLHKAGIGPETKKWLVTLENRVYVAIYATSEDEARTDIESLLENRKPSLIMGKWTVSSVRDRSDSTTPIPPLSLLEEFEEEE